MSSGSNNGEFPTFIPYWNMRLAAHGYMQWVHEGRPPTIDADFMERILYSDNEAIAHFRYIDARIEFEKRNPGSEEAGDILKELGLSNE